MSHCDSYMTVLFFSLYCSHFLSNMEYVCNRMGTGILNLEQGNTYQILVYLYTYLPIKCILNVSFMDIKMDYVESKILAHYIVKKKFRFDCNVCPLNARLYETLGQLILSISIPQPGKSFRGMF